ncbi:RNA-binding protein [Trypanosoma cruzi]|nr:RNA-binding protein [Trypanosoma cruzi]
MLSGSGTDAPGKSCSVDTSETVLLHTPSHIAVPRNHWKQPAAGGGYRAHLRVVTENSVSLVVGRSGPRNRRLGRAWDQRTLPFSVTSGCTYMLRHRNAACMTAPRCIFPLGPSHPSCCWKACPVTTKRVYHQTLRTNILPSKVTASTSLTSSAGSVMGQRLIGR